MNNSIHHPQVTVIMPVYNAEKHVYDAIDSILKQTFSDFELLVFNDCSTDSSRDIILSFKDSRIRLVDSPINTGYVKHLNEGLQQAKGRYIARMDADDVASSDRFEQQLQYLNQHEEVAACGSWIEFIGSKQGILKYPVEHRDIITHLFLFGNAMAHPAVMMRKSIVTDYQLSYDESLEPAEDYELWNRIANVAQLHNIPKVLLKYRVHERNESVVKKGRQDAAVAIIREQMVLDQWAYPSSRITSFIIAKHPIQQLTNLELTKIRQDICHLLDSKKYNDRTIKTVLNNRFVAYCKASRISGYLKMLQYLRFPKPFFSIRICLSLLINK